MNKNREYLELVKALDKKARSVSVHNICDNAKVFLVSTFTNVQKLVVLPSEEEALSFFYDYKYYDENVFYYSERDLLFENKKNKIIDKNRINILTKLSKKENITVVATISGVLEKIPKMKTILERTLKLNTDDNISELIKDNEIEKNDNSMLLSYEDFNAFDRFIKKLVEMGYTRVDEIEEIGDFAVHGGIVDIYDISYENPIRIEFFGDIIDSIRFFDINTKRTIEIIGDINISPHTFKKNYDFDEEENLDNDKDLINETSLIDYLKNDRIIFLDEPKRLVDRTKMIYDMLYQKYNDMIEDRNEESNNEIVKNIILKNDDALNDDKSHREKVYNNIQDDIDIFSEKYLFDLLTRNRCIQFTNFDDESYVCSDYEIDNSLWDLSFDITTTTPIYNKKEYSKTLEDIKNLVTNGYKGQIILNSFTKAKRVEEELVGIGINAFYAENKEIEIYKSNVVILVGNLTSGFVCDEEKYFVLTEKDIWGIEIERKHKIQKIKKRILEGFEEINDVSSLVVGDYIVHEVFGVGIYKGIKRITSDGVTKDYVALEYADGGSLYVLVTKLDVVQKFASKEADRPRLDKLSSDDFSKTRLKAKEEAFKMAEDLVELYAKRLQNKGFKFSSDNLWQKEFEETFPYIETNDQLKTIEEVKQDMESEKSMDRLICGDVGFGKTEVAIRSSFKAIQDNKQVAYLVPTTVLCMQHFKTFSERFKDYPIVVDYLSRFKSNIENKKTIEKIKNGYVDIVIGTHRLLSDDVIFKDLGLLIIDEEQRFGVTHKEKIKKLKNNVDVMTLSATPIPRTLYMSLSGIRDISIMKEAPKERLPIKTYVLEYNEELIKEAIDRELKRDGQVFVVHNRVQDIYDFAEKIQRIVPYAKISIAHGQLDEKDLSKVMLDFIEKKTNVLVTTTIIETGIDIQNANTLIIDDCDTFGMSQLYQLRGRVGRSNKTSYAFLFYKKGKILTDTSEKRLKAIKEFTSLGSGIKIAYRDLEIRGAGNVLGMTQSGHIEAIGYELYCKYLNNAMKLINENKNINIDAVKQNFVESYDTSVDVDLNAFIPRDYISSDDSKLDIYRKIAKCEKKEDFDIIKEELVDRFGKIPIEIQNLIKIAQLKIKAKKAFVTDLVIKKNAMRMVLFNNANIDTDIIFKIIDDFRGFLHFSNENGPTLTYKDKKNANNIEKMISVAEYIIDKILQKT